MVATDTDALHDALVRLDLSLRLAVEELRTELAERAADPLRGLYISDADADGLLGEAPPEDAAERLLGEPAGAIVPRLGQLARTFHLDAFEQETLLICLAPELDLRYERLYAYLQDDVSRRRPTVDLLLRLLSPSVEARIADRRTLGPLGRLFASGLVVLADEAAANWPLLNRPLRLDERIADYLLGSDQLDARVAACARLYPPDDTSDVARLEDPQGSLVRLLMNAVADGAPGPLIYVHGPSGAAKRASIHAACSQTGRPLLLVGVDALLSSGKAASALALAAREALLQDAVLALDGFGRLLHDEPEVVPVRTSLRTLLVERLGPTFLIGETRWEPAAWLPESRGIRVELPALPLTSRLQIWRRQIDGQVPADEVAELAARFRLDEESVRAVGAAARLRAAWRGDNQVEPGDVRAAARAIAAPPLAGLAHRLDLRYGWDDIVLPADGMAQLREICSRARYQITVLERWGFGRKHARRAGLTALFAGQPGTGKTMAAEIVAGALGLELYRIDLAAVVSKYIGETEKNLETIFRAADQGDAVLLFDEAEALFGKRSEVRDAHDRYANVEVAYLLQRLETYDGPAILTTNLRGSMDEAFVRRLDFVLEFPMPEEAERVAIWHLALPREAPLDPDLDLAFLARKFRLTGGHIRNIALGAAFLAAGADCPIGMKHLVRATRREYQKLGKMVGEGDFEHYYGLLKDG
ncbi:MAG TPA: ATP-binding protein [Chloroflexota bacterium]|nr:ATP-binding protein [Chloroflexota bacterium]